MKYLSVLLLLFFSMHSHSKYVAIPFHQMILKADLGVCGTIESQTDKQFKLKIDEVIFSKFQEKTITINKFDDWTCAKRWADYEIGQRIYLFLRKDKSAWKALSGGNEGECPIVGSDIYVRGTSMNRSGYENGVGFHEIGGKKAFYGSKLNFQVFLNAIKKIRNCYRFVGAQKRGGGIITRKCSVKEVEELAKENDLLKWLVKICEAN